MTGCDYMIELINVCYYYNDKLQALNNINLRISEGESVAFIGPNGSGKSTLMKLINGLILPDSGKYIFEGNEITKNRLDNPIYSKSLHKKIGFVFQNPDVQLFCTNVYDEIAFGMRQMGLNEAQVDKRVKDALNFLEIEDLAGRQPYNLSGGEKKKVAIASILVTNPDVYVLDEPMNSLDPKTKRFIRNFMIKINKAGKTILCSTHDFEYIEGAFKRAVVFSKDHTIVRDGEFENIINDKEFLRENNII